MPIRTQNMPLPMLNPQRAAEAGTWQDRVMAQAQRACRPLVFSQAQGDDMPIPFEVTRNGDGKVVIHFFQRPDVPTDVLEDICRKTLTDQFGKPTPNMRDPKTGVLPDVGYRDEMELARVHGYARPLLPANSIYVEFPKLTSDVLPESDTLRDSIAKKIKGHWVISGRTA